MISYLASRIDRHKEQSQARHEALRDHPQRVLQAADRACCCSARPSVIIVIPPNDSREHPTALLFCRHHYRESRGQLAIAGAVSFDAYGNPI